MFSASTTHAPQPATEDAPPVDEEDVLIAGIAIGTDELGPASDDTAGTFSIRAPPGPLGIVLKGTTFEPIRVDEVLPDGPLAGRVQHDWILEAVNDISVEHLTAEAATMLIRKFEHTERTLAFSAEEPRVTVSVAMEVGDGWGFEPKAVLVDVERQVTVIKEAGKSFGISLSHRESRITNISPTGLGALAGLRVGDVIKFVNGTPIRSEDGLFALLRALKDQQSAVFEFATRVEQPVPERAELPILEALALQGLSFETGDECEPVLVKMELDCALLGQLSLGARLLSVDGAHVAATTMVPTHSVVVLEVDTPPSNCFDLQTLTFLPQSSQETMTELKARVSRFVSMCDMHVLSIDTASFDNRIGAHIDKTVYRDRERYIDYVYLVVHVHYNAVDRHNRTPRVKQAIQLVKAQNDKQLKKVDSWKRMILTGADLKEYIYGQ